MKNIFVVGLQRTGTNYVERLLNDSVEGIDFRGYVRDGGQNYSKHEFPYIKEAVTNSIIKQDGFIVVVKNPYMWVESICFRDVYSFLNSKAYGVHTGTYKLKEETEIKVGDKRYNIFNILKLYKEYPEYIYDLSNRTLVRDLNKAGNKISQGKWEITKNLN